VLRQRLSAPRTLHAPHHLDVEVASSVRGLAAGQKITDYRGEQMLADYSRLRITRHPVWPYLPRMWELRHNLGAYDRLQRASRGTRLCAADRRRQAEERRWAPCDSNRLPLALAGAWTVFPALGPLPLRSAPAVDSIRVAIVR
jgi:hypothetical protein